jgi:hypothetical protein
LDANNPVVRDGKITQEQFLRLPHLVYGIGRDRQLNLADQYLAQIGIQRQIDVTVESFSAGALSDSGHPARQSRPRTRRQAPDSDEWHPAGGITL